MVAVRMDIGLIQRQECACEHAELWATQLVWTVYGLVMFSVLVAASTSIERTLATSAL